MTKSQISYKYMRALVIFDLPVLTKPERKDATRFRKALLDDGFEMLQYSVYTRLCPNRENMESHFSRMQQIAPKKGSIRMIYVTENQYANMKVLAGEKSAQEKSEKAQQLAFF